VQRQSDISLVLSNMLNIDVILCAESLNSVLDYDVTILTRTSDVRSSRQQARGGVAGRKAVYRGHT
jgi:hypothetical protein